MGIISDVKCSRCDRRYSGLRSRCPYCGALRAKRGKRASDSDNALWKLIIGVLLLVVLIAAVIILLVTSLGGDDGQAGDESGSGDIQSGDLGNPEDGITGDDGVNSVDGTDPTPDMIEPDPGITEPDPNAGPATPIIDVVQITYVGSPKTDITMNIGDVLQLGYTTVPAVESTAQWKSSDESKLVVLQSGEVRAIGEGDVTITVTVDGVDGECIVRVKP